MPPRDSLGNADQEQHSERDGEQDHRQRGGALGVARLEMPEDRDGRDLGLEWDVAADQDDRTELAHGLGLTATAEGVETIEQLRLIQELGCDVGQGYLISPPMPPQALVDWKKEFRKRWPSMISDEKLALWADAQ